MMTDHELQEIRREVLDEAVRDHGPRAVKDLLDEIARESRDELKGAEVALLFGCVAHELIAFMNSSSHGSLASDSKGRQIQ